METVKRVCEGQWESKAITDPLQPGIADKILRFHVLANSDSKEDQEVKKKVRDAVGAMMEPKLAGSTNLEETEAIVQRSMANIVEVATETLEENGYYYGASARLANVEFPVKSYGAYTFPAGEYEALQVTLGEGEGHNWWCVLYPNMCFRGSVYEVPSDEAKHALREVLTPEEYEDIFRHGKYQIRFKFLEYFR
ncbi:MAG: stage II sporulation protein R [Agathobacter sp.]|nr:stage II sporulation protein R [Agathobacter sp.]